MSKNVIFCYSGTGNCLDLAKNIAKGIGGADIIMMRKEPVITDVRDADRVGFVFPCYGGGAPFDVLRYARKIKYDPLAYTFAVSQSASYPGTGLAELNKIIPLDYHRAVTHQCSCIWLFPHNMMIPPLSAEDAQARSEQLAAVIADEVFRCVTSARKPRVNKLNDLENTAWPKLMYKKASEFRVSDACTGCGLCVKLCPKENIRLVNNYAVIGTNCAQCMGCLQYCPVSAISIGKITDKREHYHNPNVKATDLMEDVIHVAKEE